VCEESAGDGRARLSFDASEKHLNQAGALHGGILVTLADAAMGAAARSTRDNDEAPATSQLSIAFLSAGREGHLVAEAAVRKQGDQVLLCEADVEQDGRTLVHAVATFAVLRR
jgi:uncharacterized protein (TIGR00369 family)